MEDNKRTEDVVELRRLHDGWIAANLIANVRWLRENLHEDFMMFNNNGANYTGIENVVELWKSYQKLAQQSAKAQKPESKPAIPTLDDFDVNIIQSGDMATVSYQARWIIDFGASGAKNLENVNETSRGTEVYLRSPEGWKMVHFHASPLKAVA